MSETSELTVSALLVARVRDYLELSKSRIVFMVV